VDDFRVCSDLCEENGFIRQAEMLRSLAEGRGKAYLVVERGYEFNDDRYFLASGGEPRSVFFDRAGAEREAERRNYLRFRDRDPVLSLDNEIEIIDGIRDIDELARRIGAILGREYGVDELYGRYGEPLFPGSATDDQVFAISKLFKIEIFSVVETEFAV
jgi:hypothetical protein